VAAPPRSLTLTPPTRRSESVPRRPAAGSSLEILFAHLDTTFDIRPVPFKVRTALALRPPKASSLTFHVPSSHRLAMPSILTPIRRVSMAGVGKGVGSQQQQQLTRGLGRGLAAGFGERRRVAAPRARFVDVCAALRVCWCACAGQRRMPEALLWRLRGVAAPPSAPGSSVTTEAASGVGVTQIGICICVACACLLVAAWSCYWYVVLL